MTLLQISLAMFAAGACGGFLLTSLIAMKRRYPRALPTGHGLLGLSALMVLGYALTKDATPVPPAAWWAAGVLTAACGGGFLLLRVFRPRGHILRVALMHGGLALLGIVLLARITSYY